MQKKFLIILILAVLLAPFISSAQENAPKKKAYFFFLTSCPHCHNVDNYFASNGIYDKYDITKMDAANPFNANLLNKFYDASGEPGKGGVPAVTFGDKFIVGDQPIIDNFTREIDAAENANVLPDPSNIAFSGNNAAAEQNNSIGSQKAQPASQNGNKKNIFSVVVVALVIIGGGALIFVNRKKSNK